MSRLKLGLALGLFALVLLVATAPARIVSWFLPEGQVIVHGFSGTLWNGRASSCLVRVRGGYLQLGEVEWQLAPLSLVLLSPRLDLETRWGSQQFEGEVVLEGSDSLSLYDVEANLPASLAQQFLPVSLEGTLSAQFGRLRVVNELPVETEGRLVWQNGAWLSPQGRLPLGSYALELSQPADALLSGEIISLAGPVQAEGIIEVDGRSYRVDALLSAEGTLDPQLQQALSLVAVPEGDAFRVRLGGEM